MDQSKKHRDEPQDNLQSYHVNNVCTFFSNLLGEPQRDRQNRKSAGIRVIIGFVLSVGFTNWEAIQYLAF
jgi:hypothetical protein